MKAFTFIVAIATLIIGFSACERSSQIIQPAVPQIEDQSDDISIGVALPLTGQVAATGALVEEGFTLAIDEIKKAGTSPIGLRFIFEDDMGSAEGAMKAVNKLIHTDKVTAILGPSTSSATQAGFPIAQENKIAALSPSAGASGLAEIGDFVFRLPLAPEILVARGIKVTQAKLGYQRVATLYNDTDLFSTDRDRVLQETFAANGIEVLTTETFQSGDTDYSAQLTRIKALNPDAIFVSALPPEKPGVLIQGEQLGISVPFVVSSLTDVEVQAAGAAAEGAITFIRWTPTDDTPGNRAFVQNYTDTFGRVPNIFAASSYTSVHILVEALKNAASTDSAAIRDALAAIRDFDTILGTLSFDANGSAVYEPQVLIVKNGMLQSFE